MPSLATSSILLLSTLVAAGCGAASGLASSDSSGSAAGTTTSSGAGGSAGSAAGTTTSAGAGGSTGTGPGAQSFRVGTFDTCAQGFQGPDGNVFLNTSGIVAGAVLTVTQEGSTVTASYVGQNGVESSFAFTPTTDTSAVLASTGAMMSGFAGTCVQGPGDTGVFPATVTATAGSLDYASETIFLSLTGTIAGGASTPCGTASAPATVWVICGGSGGGPPATPDPRPATDLLAGTFTCVSQIATFESVNETGEFVAGSGTSGTLTVTESGTRAKAVYSGDPSLSGTLDFTVSSPSTADADPLQPMLASCMVPVSVGGPPPPEMPAPFGVDAAAMLMTGDTTLFLMLGGGMGPPCSGALKMGSLVCTRQ
jgi:hypothetical protein